MYNNAAPNRSQVGAAENLCSAERQTGFLAAWFPHSLRCIYSLSPQRWRYRQESGSQGRRACYKPLRRRRRFCPWRLFLSVLFCVGRRGYIFPSRAYANEADRSRCLRAEGPPQSRLYGVSGEIEAGRTSGQAVPKPHHTGCDDEVRSAGLGKAPQQTFFRFCPQGKIWKIRKCGHTCPACRNARTPK